MTLWIKNPLAVWTDNDLSDNNNDAAGGIVVDCDVISELIPKGGSPKSQVDATMDASNCVALFNLNEPRFAGAGDPVAALVLCGAHQAEHVMVKGRWKVTDGHLASGDLESLLAKQRQIAANLTSN